MLEKALHGSWRYWLWMAFLLFLVGVGFFAYVRQFTYGLGLTGMSRDVTWGLYISQFTFLVGVAASGVMVAIPYYLHDFKTFGKIVILGEFLAVASIVMAVLFVFVDLGQPTRVLNVLLYPTPHSIMFWDICVLSGYLLLNIVIGWTVLGAEKKGFAPPRWTRVLTIVSIPWAISIHTVTAFLYAGIPGKDYWLTAIMAARFLSSAFASGPALLIIICLVLRRLSSFKVENSAVQALAKIVLYAFIVNVFFFILEVFTAFYSGVPGHQASLLYLFAGLDGHDNLVFFMWAATVLAFLGIVLLLVPKLRRNPVVLPIALLAVFAACWLDKGLGLILGGFVPNSFEGVVEYLPSANELMVVCGVFGLGMLIMSVLYKIVISVRRAHEGDAH
ncbi:MAG: polysulfide reductase NrfD [Coriobacteriales bacterium]|jgi:molybdopterin-containing oxidoreductase family membrane subunit|nr:polysulfide reductase NrfD [Coriobacteriales bacterium]